MSYEVALPDGRVVEFPDNVPHEEAERIIREQLLTPKPKEGLVAGLEKGAESVYSQMRSGLGALLGSPEEAARAGLGRGEDIGKRYADQVSLEKVKQAYEKNGLLSAAGEAISQVPYAIAEQIPNLGTALGGARLGALAGSPFGPAGAIVGGTAGLVAPSFLQQLGGNVERQAAEGQPVSVSGAATAAVPQAALDIAGSFIPLGGRLVSKITGLPVETLLGRTSAQATKLADEKLLATLAKGTATGALAEIPTEVAQQMLERAQAGLSLTSPDALKEYGETAYQVGLLGPIGVAGRMSEIGGARQQVEQERMLDLRKKRMAQVEEEDKARAAQEAAAAAEEARRQTPEFAMQAEAAYNELQQQFIDLREQAKGKVDPTDLAAVEAQKAAQAALKTFKKSDKYKQVIKDYQETAAIRAQLKKQQEEIDRQKAEDDKQKEIALELQKMGQQPGVQQTIPGLEPMETENVPPAPQEEFVDYAQQARALGDQLDVLREKAKNTKNLDEKIALGEQYNKIEKARAEAEKKAKEINKPEQQLNILKRKMEIAEEEGDIPAQVELAQKMKALGYTGEAGAQQEIPLEKFKAKSETVPEFYERIMAPRRAAARESSQQRLDLLEQEDEIFQERQRRGQEEIDKEAERERVVGLEKSALQRIAERRAGASGLSQMRKARLPQDVTEQLDMFGYPLAGGVVTGEKAAAPKSRAELVAEFQIARATRNRDAMAEAAEKIRDIDAKAAGYTGEKKEMDTKGLTQPAVPLAKAAMPGQQPLQIRQQQAYADARAKAYADMVAIVSKYNQGKAKLSELEAARGTLVENLIGDIEATRGTPVEKAEADQIRRDANALLYDLVTRFGDTRNLSQKGTAKRPLFIPAQDSQGNFTSESQYPTVESRAPGRQTFANPHAAALAIKEGLDNIRNKAVAEGTTTVTRTFTPEETSPEALREELDRAFAKGPSAIPAEQRDLLEQVADNLKAISADTDKRNLVAEYAYRANNGLVIDPSITRDVKDMLAAMEQGKRSETELVGGKVKRAVQTDLDKTFGSEALRGRVFDTPEAFDQYLASDALQQMRSTIGMTKPTLSRLVARMAPFIKRAENLQTKVDELQAQYDAILDKRKAQFAELEKLTGEEAAQEKRERLQAEAMLKEAEANLKAVTDRLDLELRDLQIAYIEAEQAFSYSVQVSEDITKAIEANTTDFTKAEMAAIADVLKAKKKLTDLFEKLKSDDYPGGRNKGFAEVGPNTDWSTRFASFKNRPDVLALQNEIVSATRRWRANFNLNQSENRIVKFLDQDLNYQMQLQEEAAQMDALAKNLLNAGLALDLAKDKQERSTKNKKALQEATAKIFAARETASEVQKRAQERAEAIDQLERELGVERKTIRHRMSDDQSELVIFNALTNTKELEDQLAAIRTQISAATNVPSRALQAFIARRERAQSLGQETQAQREERDKVQKRLENEQTARLKAIPGEQISFEGRRKLLETLDATPERLAELDTIINDEKAPAKDVEEATRAKKRLEKKVQDISNLLSNDGEVAKKVMDVLDARIDKVEENIKKVTQRLNSPDKYDEILAQKRLSKANREAAIAGKKKLRDGRIKEINKYKRELAELKAERDVKRGIERKEVGTQRYVEDIAPEGAARTLVPIDNKTAPAPEIGAKRALRQAYAAAVKDGASEVEYKGRTYAIEDVRSYLAERQVGPVVKKTVTAGNIRTGELETTGERKLSTRNKPLQGGAVRPVTNLQAQRATDEAVKRISKLQLLQTKVEDALEDAKDAGDKALIERYSKGLKSVKNKIKLLESELPQPLDQIKRNVKPKKGMTEAQLEAERRRVRGEPEEELEAEEPEIPKRPSRINFSKGSVAKGLTAKSLQEELDKAVGGKGITQQRVKVFDSVADFYNKDANAEYEYPNLPTDAKAFVDPKTGQAFMFANNIGKGDGLAVFLHEVGAHLGFRNLFNQTQYNALVKAVKNWSVKNDGSLESRVAKAAIERIKAAKTSAEQYDDELLAYAIEEAVKAGVTPSVLRNGSPIRSWLTTVLNLLKKALAKFGINPDKLLAGDLVNLAYGAAQLEVRGAWHGSDATFKAFDKAYAGAGEGSFDRRFDGDNSLGAGPYVTPDKEYGEYYQHAVPFGKAANESGYGRYSYQDYAEALANETYKADTDRSTAEIQRVFESNLLHRYLNSLLNGGDLDPNKNTAALSYIPALKTRAAELRDDAEKQLASRQKRKVNADRIEEAEKYLAYALRFDKAVDTLDVSKIKGLTARPAKGNLYRTLDDIPREKVFSVNSEATVGERPKIDALLKEYGPPYELRNFEQDGKYNMNSLYYNMRKKLGVEKTNALLKTAGIEAVEQINDRKYIERAYLGGAPEILGMNLNPVGPAEGLLFSKKPTYVNEDFAFAGSVADKFIGKNKTIYDKVKANASGLAFETQYVDRFAGFERLSKLMEPLIGTQMMYYLRMYDQRMNFVSQAVANGALNIVEKTRKDGRIERVIEAGGGASIANTVKILRDAAPLVGNGEAVNRLFTMYMSAIRAEEKGFATLHFGEDLTHADLKAAKAAVEKNPEVKKIFDAARAEYNQYNKDMMNFLAQTGAISKETAANLTKNNDYIPWYRERNGVAELVIGSETPIKIGNIKEQPYLQELVGGDRPILDFMTSSVQNTNMLVDMGLRNLSTKNAVLELVNMDLAKITKAKIAGPDVVRFKVDGQDRYAIINTDDAGVPADVLVKGMEGIPTQMPGMFRLLGMPATFLRKAVTASPLYAAKQLFRDSLAAPILVGADFMPVTGALRQIGRTATKETLERRGITGGQIFTGSSEDISKILRDIADNKSGWLKAFGKLEAINMEADASTRRAQYNSYINQGLSEMEATLMSLESMNFNKRGASPSVHWANSLIPFFNAQIQSLNVLYKALTGKLPFNEKLKIQKKLLLRGGMIAAGTLAYAAAMRDDEAYKNAKPDQKYGNWFIRLPNVDEPIRLPIPFEIGYIFKALPEAVYNTMVDKHGGEEAVKAFGNILKQLIPGGTSYGIPQALRPAIEAGLGKSFYTGRDILSPHEQTLLPQDQFRENTSEVAKTIGRAANVSPIILDQLVQGYTGPMGLAFVQAVGLGLTKQEGPQAAVKRLSDLPLVGSAFQPNDAGAISTRVYDRMNEFKKVQASVDDLFNRGYKAEAMDLLNKRANEYAASEMADYYISTMRELTQYENAIKASNIPPEQKREQLDNIRKIKTRFSTTVEEATDRTIPR